MAESGDNKGQGSQSSYETALNDQANSLLEHIRKGDFSGAMDVISELNATRDRTLYQEVGRLTRTLHEAIRNFNIETGDARHQNNLSEITDASDRLAYVVDMTSKAANKTMDLVEETMPLAVSMKEEARELKEAWAKLRRREMEPDEFRALYTRIDTFFGQLTIKSERVHANLSEILLAQDFQDLTGQVIQKVTRLVRDVEENLVNLVVMAGNVDRITGTVHQPSEESQPADDSRGHGPQMRAAEREDVVANQDDVDDLLSSLGF